MFWENNQRRSSNMFFWGAVSGIVGGIYITKWMKTGHQHHHDFNQHEKHSSGSSKVGSNVENKDQLFETFMHGSEQEIKEKASDMKLKN